MSEPRVAHEKGNLVTGRVVRMWDDMTPLIAAVAQFSNPVLFFNVGSDRVTGDALGPLLGTFLMERGVTGFDDVAVLGTLDATVHASNLEENIERAKREFGDYVWIAVDACLGASENIGSVTFAEGMLTPGAGVGKMLPPVGDYVINGVVNMAGFMEYFVLQNTPVHVVYNMAQRIADAIMLGLEQRAVRLRTMSGEV